MEAPRSASAHASGSASPFGLTSLAQWTASLADGVMPVSGGFFRVEMRVDDLFGHGLSPREHDAFLTTLAARIRSAIERPVELLHDDAFRLYGWMPAASPATVHQIVSELASQVGDAPICLPGGCHVLPVLQIVGQMVKAGSLIDEVLSALHAVQAHPDSAVPDMPMTGIFTLVTNEIPFAVDATVERAIRALRVPERAAVTLLLAGQPDAGHDAIATRLLRLMRGQLLATADIACDAAQSQTSYATVMAILRALVEAVPHAHTLPVLTDTPWLRDALAQTAVPMAACPQDATALCMPIADGLRALAPIAPVVAVVRNIERADDASLALLSAIQEMPGHALRIIATLEVEATASLTAAVQAFVTHCRIFTPEPPAGEVVSSSRSIAAEPQAPILPPGEHFSGKILPQALEVWQVLRRAAAQMRLYPMDNPLVKRQVTEAHETLSTFLILHERLSLVLDDTAVLCGGHALQRVEQRAAVRDFEIWMRDGGVHALTLSLGITEEALITLLHEFTTYDNKRATLSLAMLVRAMNLPGVVVTDANPGAEEDLFALVEDKSPDAPVKIAALDHDGWQRLPQTWARCTPGMRRGLLSEIQSWMSAFPDAAQAMAEELDRFFCHVLKHERSTIVVSELARTIAQRLAMQVDTDNDDRLIFLLDAVRLRMDDAGDHSARHAFESSLAHAGSRLVARIQGFARGVDAPEEMDALRALAHALGVHLIRPLIAALKTANSMQERALLIRLLRDVAREYQELLLVELRDTDNPWYVHRNMLQIIGDIGSETALGAIRTRITHPDPRVRAEAVAAATRIARANAAPYLAQGLEDSDARVRLRSASLAALCPQPSILQRLLVLLQMPHLGTEPPTEFQIAATLALGHFPQEEARAALLQILYPPMIAQYPVKPDEVRAAAVTALVHHRGMPPVEKSLAQARNDRSSLVRQAARRLPGEGTGV